MTGRIWRTQKSKKDIGERLFWIIMGEKCRSMPMEQHIWTSSARLIMEAMTDLYHRIVDPNLSIRRVTVAVHRLTDEQEAVNMEKYEQLDLFTDYEALEKEREAEAARLEKERKLQEAMISVKKKYGKNAILKGMNLQEGATTIERNRQIGGHKA